MKRILITAAAAAAVLAGSAAMAAPAMASNGPVTVTANTHLNNHPDTTVGPVPVAVGSALVNSPDGPVWAYDNETTKFTIAPEGGTLYKVSIDIVGSFHGFADPGLNGNVSDPNYGAALTSDGSVKGTIVYDVNATQAPNASLLPGQSPSGAHLSDLINTLFGGSVVPNSIVQVGNYGFSYQNGNYICRPPPSPVTWSVTDG